MHGFVFKTVRSVTESLTFREVSYAPFQGANNLEYKYTDSEKDLAQLCITNLLHASALLQVVI